MVITTEAVPFVVAGLLLSQMASFTTGALVGLLIRRVLLVLSVRK